MTTFPNRRTAQRSKTISLGRISAICAAPALLLTLLTCSTGCGSGFAELLFQAASATGRAVVDVAITDLANNLADQIDAQNDDSSDGDGGDVDDGGGDSGDGGGGGGGGDVVGDATAGETLYSGNGCASCHCADASGGCALSAPSLVGVSAEELELHLGGGHSHPLQIDASAQDIADLEAYLASIAG